MAVPSGSLPGPPVRRASDQAHHGPGGGWTFAERWIRERLKPTPGGDGRAGAGTALRVLEGLERSHSGRGAIFRFLDETPPREREAIVESVTDRYRVIAPDGPPHGRITDPVTRRRANQAEYGPVQ